MPHARHETLAGVIFSPCVAFCHGQVVVEIQAHALTLQAAGTHQRLFARLGGAYAYQARFLPFLGSRGAKANGVELEV